MNTIVRKRRGLRHEARFTQNGGSITGMEVPKIKMIEANSKEHREI